VEGPFLGPTRFLADSESLITPGQPFALEAVRSGSRLAFSVDGVRVWAGDYHAGPIKRFGLRPWRARMRVYAFELVQGRIVEAFDMTGPYSIPIVDLSAETWRQTVVAQGTPEVYQGHPHTLLMPDGRTLYAVWTYDHGGRCGPMKRSDDAGRTWSELLPTPESWTRVPNCPTIHRLTDPDRVSRLFVFAGNGPMMQAVSEDEGATWSDMTPNGLKTIVAPMSVIEVRPGLYRMWFQRGPGDADRAPLTVWQADSTDGGLTWHHARLIVGLEGASPCEPGVVASPDGRTLACLMRENTRRLNSLVSFSRDAGDTWSPPRELPGSLTGDRHCLRYAPDGRLVCVFRDMAEGSSTLGHFVGWVGTFDDIEAGREGQCRILLLRHHGRPGDCGYPGLELLPNGEFLATTYVQLRPDDEKNSVVSVRFCLEDVDGALRTSGGQ
jgi:hypothetical protein